MIRFEVYPETRHERGLGDAPDQLTGNYRWRARSGNGQITAGSQESFASESNALRAARRFVRSIQIAYEWEIPFRSVES